MSAATHTPGPWRIGGDCDGFAWVVAPDGRSVANIEDGSFAMRVRFEAQTVKANAALIAAAPDLLAVVQELSESAAYWGEYDVPVGIVDRMNAAIAKAEGRS